MFNISVDFNKQHKMKLLGAANLIRSAVLFQADELPKKHAKSYRDLLVNNIISQKYASDYAEYNDTYKKWKTKNAPSKRYWELAGDIINGITFGKSRGRSQKVFIPRNLKESVPKSYSNSKKRKKRSVAWYAWIQENGGTFTESDGTVQTHHARPVWGPTFRDYIGEGGQKHFLEAKKYIKGYWR